MIGPGACVIIHLGSPREQVFGLLISLNASGIVVRGLSLASVDDWIRQVAPHGGHPGAEAALPHEALGLSTVFYPMARVEKLVLDEDAWGVASVSRRFRERTGLDVKAHLAVPGEDSRGE